MRRAINPEAITHRLFKRVEYELNTGCWLWSGHTDKHGYGRVKAPKRTRVHRVFYEMFVGPVPDFVSGKGLIVRHKCDTPSCVNPNHLELGTQADNIRDRVLRGRGRKIGNRGEKHPLSKLTAAQIEQIRSLKQAGASRRQLADMFGVSTSQIWRIVNKRQWNHG